MLHKKGLPKSVTDELEALSEDGLRCPFVIADMLNQFSLVEDIDNFLVKVEKLSPSLAAAILPYVEEIKETMHFAVALGATRPIVFLPFMLHQDTFFTDGIYFEIVRRKRRSDVIASGGR